MDHCQIKFGTQLMLDGYAEEPEFALTEDARNVLRINVSDYGYVAASKTRYENNFMFFKTEWHSAVKSAINAIPTSGVGAWPNAIDVTQVDPSNFIVASIVKNFQGTNIYTVIDQICQMVGADYFFDENLKLQVFPNYPAANYPKTGFNLDPTNPGGAGYYSVRSIPRLKFSSVGRANKITVENLEPEYYPSDAATWIHNIQWWGLPWNFFLTSIIAATVPPIISPAGLSYEGNQAINFAPPNATTTDFGAEIEVPNMYNLGLTENQWDSIYITISSNLGLGSARGWGLFLYLIQDGTNYWARHILGANTTANGASASGQAVLNVVSSTGFGAGDTILINPGGNTQETGTVLSVGAGTITLNANLSYNHVNAEVVGLYGNVYPVVSSSFLTYQVQLPNLNSLAYTKTGLPTTINIIALYATTNSGAFITGSFNVANFFLYRQKKNVQSNIGGGLPVMEKVIVDRSLYTDNDLQNLAQAELARQNYNQVIGEIIIDGSTDWRKPGYTALLNAAVMGITNVDERIDQITHTVIAEDYFTSLRIGPSRDLGQTLANWDRSWNANQVSTTSVAIAR